MKPKPILAALFAVAGAGAAVYSYTALTHKEKPGTRLATLDQARGTPRDQAPELQALGGAKPDSKERSAGAEKEGAAPPETSTADATPPEPANFPAVGSEEAVGELMTNLATKLDSAVSAVPDVTAMGVQASSKLASSARTALEPMFLGSRSKVVEAIKALGGTPPDPNAPPPTGPDGQPMPRRPAGGALVDLLKGASLDYSRAKILPVFINGEDKERNEMMAQMNRGGAVTEAGNVIPGTTAAPGAAGSTPPDSQRPPERRSVMKMMTRGMYPDAEDYKNKKFNVVEVRMPVLLAGETQPKPGEEMEIGINMAWNPGAQAWQPCGFALYPNDPKDAMKIAQSMRAAAAAGPPS